MKIADWRPRRRIVLDNNMIISTSTRDRHNGVTTDTPPTKEVMPKVEVKLDSGHLVTIAANRVRYVTDCV